ncbi:MAG TPA: bifunctional 3,4-dihydroxy-2-butanone-4-phosphate synthase/GTP cyclohydrolase II, partial [Actinomycetota bacterium]|nr:bifunctional 3,4-dihydroxy-2-butanone-4-phosphate synthase/GTP cyclohydrolase II [Actinomycetota bacterium]
MWPREVARLVLPTPFGPFDLVAFGTSENGLLLALVLGDVGDGDPVLVRIHSECLTGDVLGSLRCDCGVQLRDGMRAIAAQGRGVLV